jgi:hypothetical protein
MRTRPRHSHESWLVSGVGTNVGMRFLDKRHTTRRHEPFPSAAWRPLASAGRRLGAHGFASPPRGGFAFIGDRILAIRLFYWERVEFRALVRQELFTILREFICADPGEAILELSGRVTREKYSLGFPLAPRGRVHYVCPRRLSP